MKIDPKDFRVSAGEKVELNKWPTAVKSLYKSKEHDKECLNEHIEKLSALQQFLYASNEYAVLLIFQAMDTLRGLPKCNQHEHRACYVVPADEQKVRPAHHFAGYPRYPVKSQNELSQFSDPRSDDQVVHSRLCKLLGFLTSAFLHLLHRSQIGDQLSLAVLRRAIGA